jgi:hypothetical protein
MSPENSFKENKYLLVENLCDPGDLYSYLQDLKSQGKGNAIGDMQDFYKEEKCQEVLKGLLPKMEEIVGLKLYRSYSLARLYPMGSILRSHTDREACEITASICLGNSGTPWPIWLLDKEQKAHQFNLQPGDGVIFRGRELPHWRERNTFGPCGMLFLHYLDQAGPYSKLQCDLYRRRNAGFAVRLFSHQIKFHFELNFKAKKSKVD